MSRLDKGVITISSIQSRRRHTPVTHKQASVIGAAPQLTSEHTISIDRAPYSFAPICCIASRRSGEEAPEIAQAEGHAPRLRSASRLTL